jgi:hypothetical protein
MPNDPLEHLKRIQAHLEALRRARQGQPPNVNLSNPNINPANVQFRAPGGPLFGSPSLPDPLIEWMLQDLPPRTFHDVLNETVSRLKIKGYRPGHVPREEGLKILKKRYEKELPFRMRMNQMWLQSRKKEESAFRLIGPDVIRREPWPVVERFGFPLTIWLMSVSSGGIFRPAAMNILKEVSAKQGRLEEILANAAKAPSAAQDKLWSLPKVSHDDEVSRIQNEVEQILTERDQWQAQAQEEKTKREKLEAELKAARDEQQKSAQARSAAEHARQSAEARLREVEGHLEELKGAETSLRRMEKQLKELEYEKTRLARGAAEWEQSRAALSQEMESLRQALSAREKSLKFLKAFFVSEPGYLSETFQGQALLLILADDPAEYFVTAKEIGLTLLVHDGRSVDAQLEKFLGRAWRVAVLGEEAALSESVWKALRGAGKPVVSLPLMPAPAFGRLLMAAAPLLKKEK